MIAYRRKKRSNSGPFSVHRVAWQTLGVIVAAWLVLTLSMIDSAAAGNKMIDVPPDTLPVLHYLLDLVKKKDAAAFDARRIKPLMAFVQSPKTDGAIYTADGSFDAPSAYDDYVINADLQQILDYTLDADIPSFFFWPSSLRVAHWTRVDGGNQQLDRLRAASNALSQPFIVKGAEQLTITPDQHTGAYYSYDIDKMIILSPFEKGKIVLSIYAQQKPSAVGRRGWVLGEDDEWSYLYTKDKGLNVKGLGWADTYMYDSFGITLYHEPDPGKAAVTCATFSWVKAGWAGMNMVKPKHIHRGLERVAHAFTTVLENPRLPAPARLAETFAKSRDLPTPTLREYAKDYLAGLEQRITASATLSKKMGEKFDSRRLLDQMSRDELYAVVALDYFKKLLGRNPVMTAHPF
jgi:hypothetical protein